MLRCSIMYECKCMYKSLNKWKEEHLLPKTDFTPPVQNQKVKKKMSGPGGWRKPRSCLSGSRTKGSEPTLTELSQTKKPNLFFSQMKKSSHKIRIASARINTGWLWTQKSQESLQTCFLWVQYYFFCPVNNIQIKVTC